MHCSRRVRALAPTRAPHGGICHYIMGMFGNIMFHMFRSMAIICIHISFIVAISFSSAAHNLRAVHRLPAIAGAMPVIVT